MLGLCFGGTRIPRGLISRPGTLSSDAWKRRTHKLKAALQRGRERAPRKTTRHCVFFYKGVYAFDVIAKDFPETL